MNTNLRLFIELTSECNHSCSYCYYHANSSEPSNKPWSKADLNYILDTALQEYGNNMDIILTGGEPFLAREECFYVANTLRNKGFRSAISVNTNLTCLSPADFKVIKDLEIGCFVSLVHPEREKYNAITKSDNYDRFLRNLKAALALNCSITGNIVVTPENIDQLLSFADCYSSYGIQRLFFTLAYFNKNGTTSELRPTISTVRTFLDSCVALKQKYGDRIFHTLPLQPCTICLPEQETCFNCASGNSLIFIGVGGDLLSCGHYPYSRRSFGNILQGASIRRSLSLIHAWKTVCTANVPGECRLCRFHDYCFGGCYHVSQSHRDLCTLIPEINSRQAFESQCALLQGGKHLPAQVRYIGENYAEPWELCQI